MDFVRSHFGKMQLWIVEHYFHHKRTPVSIHYVFKILGAKNCQKNLNKHLEPTFQIRPGPGYFSRAKQVVSSTVDISQLIKMHIHQRSFWTIPSLCQYLGGLLHRTGLEDYRSAIHWRKEPIKLSFHIWPCRSHPICFSHIL